MLALVALICFVLALFKVHIGSVDLVVAGLCFIALHLMFSFSLPRFWDRTPR